MRLFKTKWFRRWAYKEGLDDAALVTAAKEIVAGVFDASLGHCLYKKRIARPGGGKSGGYRVIVAYKIPNQDRIVFAFGFPKSVQSNISIIEKEALGKLAETLLNASDDEIGILLKDLKLIEIIAG